MEKNDIDQRNATCEALKNMYDRESGDDPLTEVQENKLSEFLKTLNGKPSSGGKRTEKSRRFTVLQKCAVVLLCVAVVGTVSLSSADAVRLKFKGFFIKDEGDHVDLKPVQAECLDGWEDFFALAEIPEGYEIVAAEDDGIDRVILYEKGETQLRIRELNEDAGWGIDQEQTVIEQVNIRGKEGIYFYSDEYQYSNLLWIESGRQIYISSDGPEYLTREEILELANKNLSYFKGAEK